MFALPGIVALIVFIYVRPHEFVGALRVLPMLHVSCALAAIGLAVDVRSRLSRVAWAPQAGWALGLAAWGLFTTAIKAPAKLPSVLGATAIVLALYAVVAHGVQTFRAFEVVAAALLGCVLFVAAVGVEQGLSPYGCIAYDEGVSSDLAAGRPDGRGCVTRLECGLDDPEPGTEYRCERVGPLGTTTVGGGRVRYLGVLQDPNEMALALGVGLPLAIAFVERRRTAARWALLFVTFALVAACTVMSQSRGGQLVFAAVMATYLAQRVGWRGVVAAAALAAPIAMLGGRGGDEAAASSRERLECWYEGMTMWRSWPVTGVGLKQFGEHHHLTAHNSYVLAAAEMGLPGLVLWTSVLLASIGVPLEVLRRHARDAEAAVARVWARALLAAFVGLGVGAFFLSFCWHYVLWIHIGMSGALHAATRAHDARFEPRPGRRALGWLVATDVGLIAAMYAYTRLKVGR